MHMWSLFSVIKMTCGSSELLVNNECISIYCFKLLNLHLKMLCFCFEDSALFFVLSTVNVLLHGAICANSLFVFVHGYLSMPMALYK